MKVHRLKVLLLSSAAAVAIGVFAMAPMASASVSAQASPVGHKVTVINLQAVYQGQLAHPHKPGKIAGVVPGVHKQPRKSSPAASCVEPDHCPLLYQGGLVQHSPHVYLLLWGPNWSTDSSQAATASHLESFYAGLGTQPQDSWSDTTDQYTDGTGHPSFSGSVYKGVWQDTSTPPTGVDQTQLAAEADAFTSSQGITDTTDAQIVIATQSGTCPQGFYASICGGSGTYCAWHSNSNEPYTNLPYMLDSGVGCGEDFINSNGTYDGLTMVAGHEYAETITDPFPLSGWLDPNDSYGGEIGDKCVWAGENWGGSDPDGNITLSTGSFAMQSLWSNSANACVMSTTITQQDTVTVTNPGNQSSSPNSNASLQMSGSSSGGYSLTWGATGLPAGLTINASTGLISGLVTATPATYPVTVTAKDTNGASNSASFNWTVLSQQTAVQDSSPLITYGYWQGVTDTAASGGTYRQSAYTTGHASFTFSGTAVKWATIKGPDKGIASVTIDGASKGKFDLYSATKTPSVLTFSGLASKSHTIKIVVTGTKNLASSGYNVPIDAFTVGTTTTQDSSTKITYGWWAGKTSTSASGGTYRSAASAGPASFTFTGTQVHWITTTGPAYGKAEVYLDGVDQGTVDLYSPATHWQTAKSYTASGPGQHTLTIQVLAQKNTASTGKAVNIDAFTVP
jgi:serine protease